LHPLAMILVWKLLPERFFTPAATQTAPQHVGT
jgi:hypothetical protein